MVTVSGWGVDLTYTSMIHDHLTIIINQQVAIYEILSTEIQASLVDLIDGVLKDPRPMPCLFVSFRGWKMMKGGVSSDGAKP